MDFSSPETTDASTWEIISFPTFDALVACAEGPEIIEMGRSSRNATRDFWAGASFAEACNYARFGYPSGSAAIRAAINRIADALPHETANTPQYDVTGAYVDVARFIDDEPECMIDFMPDARVRRTVTIGFDCFYSACESNESIQARGIAIAALIAKLESQNIRCHVTAMLHCKKAAFVSRQTLSSPNSRLTWTGSRSPAHILRCSAAFSSACLKPSQSPCDALKALIPARTSFICITGTVAAPISTATSQTWRAHAGPKTKLSNTPTPSLSA